MLTRISPANFKSYDEATLPLAALTFLVGANAAGKSNLLEALRLLHWLAKGTRLDDIARAIASGDAMVRGQSGDLFRDPSQPFKLGLHWSSAPDGWADFEVAVSLLADQLVITGEQVTQPSEKVPLYTLDGTVNPHRDEISVAYNNFLCGPTKPHIPCSNRQAIFFQLETPGRFEAAHSKSQHIIPKVARSLREILREIVFLDPHPSRMRDYVYAKDDVIKEDGSNLSAVLYKIANAET